MNRFTILIRPLILCQLCERYYFLGHEEHIFYFLAIKENHNRTMIKKQKLRHIGHRKIFYLIILKDNSASTKTSLKTIN